MSEKELQREVSNTSRVLEHMFQHVFFSRKKLMKSSCFTEMMGLDLFFVVNILLHTSGKR